MVLEIHMMGLETIGDDGQEQDLTVCAFRGFLRPPNQKIVCVERRCGLISTDPTEEQSQVVS
jgi:hypothetical protein